MSLRNYRTVKSMGRSYDWSGFIPFLIIFAGVLLQIALLTVIVHFVRKWW